MMKMKWRKQEKSEKSHEIRVSPVEDDSISSAKNVWSNMPIRFAQVKEQEKEVVATVNVVVSKDVDATKEGPHLEQDTTRSAKVTKATGDAEIQSNDVEMESD
ncbi:hypothetical protein V6N13_024324 [Hibiscus sabdariffa]